MGDEARIKHIFGEALDLPAGEREAFLARECGGDARLRERLESMLRSAEQDDPFLRGPTVDPDGESRRFRGPDPTESPGARIGPYRILELLGEGGFGTVHLAEQESPVRRRVALKIIKRGMDSAAVVARFERERQALALMDHPNIAKVFDAGTTATGRPYFAMEYVEGEAITSYCDQRRLGVRERLGLMQQVCAAVQHAHAKGIIHRDIKPSNVIVCERDGRHLARVIDFGIAKATDRSEAAKAAFTEHRQMIGTPEYMSPEQAEGSADIDTRTDVYSLGVLLYELLTGVTPFEGRRLRSAAYAEIQRIIAEEEPPKPSTRVGTSADRTPHLAASRGTEPRRLQSLIRGDLDWIVMKALAKERGRRYGTASELEAELGRYLAGEAVLAGPASATYRIGKFARRHRVAVVAGLLLAASLVAGMVATTTYATREAAMRTKAEKAEATAKRQAEQIGKAQAEAVRRAEELERITTFQEAELRAIDPAQMGVRIREDLLREAARLGERDGTGAARAADLSRLLDGINFTDLALRRVDQDIIERALEAVRERFADQPGTRASLLQALAETLLVLGLAERALPPQEEALAIRRQHLGNENEATVASMAGLSNVLRALSRVEDDRRVSREAYETATRALGPSSRARLSALVSRHQVLREEGKLAESEAMAREAVAMSVRVLGPEDPGTAGSMSDLAIVLGAQNKLDESVELGSKAVEIRRRAQGEGHRDTLTAMNNLAFQLEEAGRLEEALGLYRSAYAGAQRSMGEDHPFTLAMLANLASATGSRGDLAEAASLHRRAYEGRLRVLGAGHEDTLTSAGSLGVGLARLGRLEESLPYVRARLEGRERLYGAEDARTLNAMSDVGSLLTQLNRLSEAEPYVRRAYEVSVRVAGASDGDALINQHNYAALLHAMGRDREAEALLVDAMGKIRVAFDASHPRVMHTLHALGKVRMALGRLEEAEDDLRAAAAGRARVHGPRHALTLQSRLVLCDVLAEQGRHEEAERIGLEVAEMVRADMTGLAGVMPLVRGTMVRLYEGWERAEPGRGHGAKAEPWKAEK